MNFTLAGLWTHMGPVAQLIVIAMGVMSMVSLLILAERTIVFRASRRHSRRYAAQLGAMLASGDFDAAAETKTEKDVGYLGRTIRAGLTAYRISATDSREEAMESVARSLERQAQREVQSLKRGLGHLATVGSTAPFVGLLGTTIGIVTAFQEMGAANSGGIGTISTGISEALVTTAFGLLVAIPAVMGYNSLQGWVDARAVDLSEASNEFLDATSRALKRTRGTVR
ncbi:MotA/TolQ/ExbB proton channel family protein [Corallococcus sp. AB011P]|uniref:MotA/TolQ/ExbB proton channel family protein n=1 Tax=unclassified Corallococcus TaxID=2685029 RepID=UPI000EA1D6FB|nr:MULTISPECIES: MotA/TolQ/ExbB proton channel family protein [unclassified Corallococcus]RKG62611.1 MotA/TolQ/ExbB proton channel family protein [Corallococcus sp. AB011P]RKH89893.1 MotA/TolQ/ExbB proton channel family protein [Corallococcus sp. AB045]